MNRRCLHPRLRPPDDAAPRPLRQSGCRAGGCCRPKRGRKPKEAVAPGAPAEPVAPVRAKPEEGGSQAGGRTSGGKSGNQGGQARLAKPAPAKKLSRSRLKKFSLRRRKKSPSPSPRSRPPRRSQHPRSLRRRRRRPQRSLPRPRRRNRQSASSNQQELTARRMDFAHDKHWPGLPLTDAV